MTSRYNFFKLCAILLSVHTTVCGGCPSLNQLIHSLPYISSPESTCITNRACYSVNCTIINQKTRPSPSKIGLTIMSCDPVNPMIEIFTDIPNLGIVNWRANYTDQSENIIPGFYLPESDHKLQGYLRVNLQMVPNSNVLMLSLTIKGCDSQKVGDCPVMKKILNDQFITCNSRHFPKQPCSIHTPFQCSENETCRQILNSSLGECQCLPGYTYSNDGVCLEPDEAVIKFTAETFQSTAEPMVTGKSSNANLVMSITIPLLVSSIIGVMIYVYRYRLIHRARALFRYRNVRVISDIEDDDDLPLP